MNAYISKMSPHQSPSGPTIFGPGPGPGPDRSTFFGPGPDPDPVEQFFLDPDPDPDGPDFLMICWSGLRKILNEIFQFDSTVAPKERDTFLIIYIR